MRRSARFATVLAVVGAVLVCVSALDALGAVGRVNDGQRAVAASGRSLIAVGRLEAGLLSASRRDLTGEQAFAAVAPLLEALEATEIDDHGEQDRPPGLVELDRRLASARAGEPLRLAHVLEPLSTFRVHEGREQDRRHRHTRGITDRALVLDGGGMLLGMLLGLVGWSGRRRVLAEYRRARADRDQLARIVDTAFDAFVATDAEGRVTRWNTRAEELFGWTGEEAVGRSVLETGVRLGSSLPRRLDEPTELVAFHRDGRAFPVEVALSSSGRDGEIHAFVRDITRRRDAERHAHTLHAVTRALVEHDDMAVATAEILRLICETYGWSAARAWAGDPASPDVALVREHRMEGARPADLHSVLRLPLRLGGETAGFMELLSTEPLAA